jgi:hypothetical protein
MALCDSDTYIAGVFYECGETAGHPLPHVDQCSFDVTWGDPSDLRRRLILTLDLEGDALATYGEAELEAIFQQVSGKLPSLRPFGTWVTGAVTSLFDSKGNRVGVLEVVSKTL